MRIGSLLVVGLAASGCVAEKVTDPIVCTAIAVSALNVTVRDAASGAPVCDASVIAIEDAGASYALRQTGDCRYAGAEERSGGFELLVTRSGYTPVRVGGIQVGRDECHVIPVQLTIDVRSCPSGCNPGDRF